jgi:hypothetical protein
MMSNAPPTIAVARSLLLPCVSFLSAEAQPAQARDAVAFYIATYGEGAPRARPAGGYRPPGV